MRVVLIVALLLAACGSAQPRPQSMTQVWQESPVKARLQAISAPSAQVVWASGLEGSVIRSLDGGAHWQRLLVPGADELQFRDVHAFDKNVALLLSAGDGDASRIYQTLDGGKSFQLRYRMKLAGFLDCFDFWDRKHGLAYGDSVDGQLFVLTTSDGGESWQQVPADALPPAGKGEGGFAASGGCVRVGSPGQAWIGTGAGGNARVVRTEDWGKSWQARNTPLVKGKSAGIMSVVELGGRWVILGGDLDAPEAVTTNVASTTNGGRSWLIASSPTFVGPIYGAASNGTMVVAVGPKGVAISTNGAQSWTALDAGDFWSVDFGSSTRFWVVGPVGKILRFDINK